MQTLQIFGGKPPYKERTIINKLGMINLRIQYVDSIRREENIQFSF